MAHPEAPRSSEDGRRDRSLRVVHSNEALVSPPSGDAPRQAWAQAYVKPAAVPLSEMEKRGGMLDRGLQARIGGMLRDVFSDLAEAPVPDRFVKLLEALEEKENGGE